MREIISATRAFHISTENMNRVSHPHLSPLSAHLMQSLHFFLEILLGKWGLVVHVLTGYDSVSCLHLKQHKFISCVMYVELPSQANALQKMRRQSVRLSQAKQKEEVDNKYTCT